MPKIFSSALVEIYKEWLYIQKKTIAKFEKSGTNVILN